MKRVAAIGKIRGYAPQGTAIRARKRSQVCSFAPFNLIHFATLVLRGGQRSGTSVADRNNLIFPYQSRKHDLTAVRSTRSIVSSFGFVQLDWLKFHRFSHREGLRCHVIVPASDYYYHSLLLYIDKSRCYDDNLQH